MSTPRQSATSAAINGQMMVCGGFGANRKLLRTCEAYDPVSNKWTALPRMLSWRTHACAATWEGRAFVLGGSVEGGDASVECFDPVLKQWSFVAPMKLARHDAAAVSIPNRGIMILGGWSCYGRLESAELYDPRTNEWTTMPWNLPCKLSGLTAQFFDGLLHIAGGGCIDHISAACWSMDVAAVFPVWSPLPSLPIPLSFATSVMI